MDTFDVGIAVRPMTGEVVSGDVALVVRDGSTLTVALADGLGHGLEARASADLALAAMRHPGRRSLDDILVAADAALTRRDARGAVMGVARFDADTCQVAFAGVGNIDLIVAGPVVTRLIAHYGILGSHARRPRTCTAPFAPNDIALLLSDGVSNQLDPAQYRGASLLSAQGLAEIIVRDAGKANDDASAVVVRGAL